MHALAAGSWIFAALLVLAGYAKVTAPAATGAALQGARLPSDPTVVRLLGAGEIVLGLLVVLVGGPLPAAGLALAYLAFAAFAWRQSSRGEGCGCFGEATAPATTLHVGINVAGVAFALAAILWPMTLAGSAATALALATASLAALLLRLALTAMPELASAADAVRSQVQA